MKLKDKVSKSPNNGQHFCTNCTLQVSVWASTCFTKIDDGKSL